MPPTSDKKYLRDIEWDYIVIDEASMIPLANIVFPLYKQKPKKFIIAGDPHQIEPIVSVDQWKNETIYTMVGLKKFEENPQTKPHKYEVELLTTQYRSVPAIGNIFSKLAYRGILKHARNSASQRPLNIGEDIKALNIITYPVSEYESIYRSKRLKNSPYQVYSALFTFEYVRHLAQSIADKNKGETFKIGIISPYRVQADIIGKLILSEKLPEGIDIQVGTIHGFQGDECDIIFAVFNTPPSISDSKDMFLNKLNIINVAISRAKDYLFIVMPDEKTKGIENLKRVQNVKSLMIKEEEGCYQTSSQEIEEKMFSGNGKYLEENAFSTGHQSVNVYGSPERIYEIRAEDSAVDVQIKR
jgi:superfamily I DNA and/or RNA helicase